MQLVICIHLLVFHSRLLLSLEILKTHERNEQSYKICSFAYSSMMTNLDYQMGNKVGSFPIKHTI